MQRHQFVLGALIALGCSGRAIDVGPGGTDTGGNDVGTGGAGSTAHGGSSNAGALPPTDCTDTTPLPVWPDSSSCAGGSDSPLVGTWNGYVENGSAPWDQLTLVITGASMNGGVCGKLTLGAGPPLNFPPATDPNVGYPPGHDEAVGGSPSISPGYASTILNGTTDGMRVRFSVVPSEPYRGWCQLQTSYNLKSLGGCGCLPNMAVMRDMSNGLCEYYDESHAHDFEVNCGKFSLCNAGLSVCKCNAAGCDASMLPGKIDFDLRFTADTAEGSNTGSGIRTDFARAN